MEGNMTDINIEEIFATNAEIKGSISGVNNTMKVEGQRRVGALWNRLTVEADKKCAELEQVANQYDVATKTEDWPDKKIIDELEHLAHLLGYLTYLGKEKWHSARDLKAVVHECMNFSNDFNYKFEQIVELLNKKNNELGKQILEKFSVNDDAEIFAFWFTWVKWEEVASQIGENPEDKVAFIESLMVCKTSRDYYDGISRYVELK